MLIYNVFSALCIAYMLGLVIAFFYKLKTTPVGRIKFIRSFKKGNFSLIYFVAIPIYTMGYIYGNPEMTFINAVFNGISKTTTLVTLRYDVSSVEDLVSANLLFAIAVYLSFVLVAINAFLLISSLTYQRFVCWKKTSQWFKNDANVRVLIVGNNKESVKVYKSVERNKHKLYKAENQTKEPKCMAAIIDRFTDDDKKSLFIESVNFLSPSYNDEDVKNVIIKTLSGTVGKTNNKTIIVINTKDDERNVNICSHIAEFIDKTVDNQDINGNEKKIVELFEKIPVFVFGNPEHEGVYKSIEENSHGCIRYINKYKRIAIDFIDKHPISKYMDQEIDRETALVKEDVNINVALIGFGKTNQQIFLTSVANNQFLTKNKENRLELKKVNYYIFDKKYPDNIKNLNHTYYRFEKEMESFDSDAYLPMPSMPAKDRYFSFEINCPKFYNELRMFLTKEKSVNCIVIGFGTDLENIDMAQKLIEKAQEWNVAKYKIFVKVRSGKEHSNIFKSENCFMIGNEGAVAYDIGEITNDCICNMAKKRDMIYRLERELKPEEVERGDAQPVSLTMKDVEIPVKHKWYVELTQLERDSNVYGVLSIRSKLNMLGLDYCRVDDLAGRDAISFEQYKSIYDKLGERKVYKKVKAEDKEIVRYCDIVNDISSQTSLRWNLAVQEHYRWNSYMISCGIVPSSKQDILCEQHQKGGRCVFTNGKNYTLRRHGNITTMDGLIEFRKMVYERDYALNPKEASELAIDIIKYDYQILDDAYWLLNEEGYAIYKI